MSGLFPETIRTDRLRLEAIRPESIDVFELYEICANDPGIDEVTEYLSWDPHATPRETQEFVEAAGERFANGEGGSYQIRLREGGDGPDETAEATGSDVADAGDCETADAADCETEDAADCDTVDAVGTDVAGDAGFDVDWDRRTMTLGIWLRKRFWGRGYSGERAAAFMALAFDRLDLDLVAVEALVDNEKSNRAIERYVEARGGRREGLLRNWRNHDGEPVDVYRYSVSREEWASNPPDVSIAFHDETAEDPPSETP